MLSDIFFALSIAILPCIDIVIYLEIRVNRGLHKMGVREPVRGVKLPFACKDIQHYSGKDAKYADDEEHGAQQSSPDGKSPCSGHCAQDSHSGHDPEYAKRES